MGTHQSVYHDNDQLMPFQSQLPESDAVVGYGEFTLLRHVFHPTRRASVPQIPAAETTQLEDP